MTVAVFIDEETERLARKLADKKSLPLADIIREAIVSSAQEAGVQSSRAETLSATQKLDRLKAIADRYVARPLLDPRSPDEIVDYDANGLPK